MEKVNIWERGTAITMLFFRNLGLKPGNTRHCLSFLSSVGSMEDGAVLTGDRLTPGAAALRGSDRSCVAAGLGQRGNAVLF